MDGVTQRMIDAICEDLGERLDRAVNKAEAVEQQKRKERASHDTNPK
jgi:hypothetical protein